MADISLITSLYHSEAYLARFTRNVLKVARELTINKCSLELILVANNPSRRERKYLSILAKRSSDSQFFQVKNIFVPRETLYASWNRGVRASSGNCIGFWNVDDIRNPNALIEAVELFQKGAGVVYFPWCDVILHKRLGIYPVFDVAFPEVPPFNRELFTRRMMVGPFFMMSRKIYDEIGPFDEQFRVAGDFDWCVYAARKVDFNRANSIGGTFFSDGTGLSARGSLQHVAEINVIYLRHGIFDKVEFVPGEMMRHYQIQFENRAVPMPEDIQRLFESLTTNPVTVKEWEKRSQKEKTKKQWNYLLSVPAKIIQKIRYI